MLGKSFPAILISLFTKSDNFTFRDKGTFPTG